MKMLSLRITWALGLIITLVLISTSYWLEQHDGMLPCLLCSLQRLAFIVLAFVFLLGLCWHNTNRWRHGLTGLVASLISGAGLWLAGRQVWLQWQPPNKMADCGISLQYLFKVLPFDKAIMKILHGSTECSRVLWTFMGLSLAEWSGLFFAVLLVLSMGQMVRAFKNNTP